MEIKNDLIGPDRPAVSKEQVKEVASNFDTRPQHISALTGDIFKQYGISAMANDITHFLCGTSLKLLNTVENSNNELLSNWAKEIKKLKNELSDALSSSEKQTFDIPGRFV